MTRFLFTSIASLLTAAAATAIVPPLPPGVVLPAVVEKKPVEDSPDDVAKLADRIGEGAKQVRDKITDQDTGEGTRRDQAKLKQDLDKLIDLLQNPPPPPMSNDSSQQPPPPNGGGGQSNPPPAGGQQPMPMGHGQQNQPMSNSGQPRGGSPRTGSGKRDRQPTPMGEPQPMPGAAGGQQPMPTGAKPEDRGQPMATGPMGSPGGNQPGGAGKSSPTLPLAETIAKDFWGHLPEVPRQRMMQFFREQYNSRYKDLLPDYFSTLAEKEKKGKP